jgi:hypothetical protein
MVQEKLRGNNRGSPLVLEHSFSHVQWSRAPEHSLKSCNSSLRSRIADFEIESQCPTHLPRKLIFLKKTSIFLYFKNPLLIICKSALKSRDETFGTTTTSELDEHQREKTYCILVTREVGTASIPHCQHL